MVSIYRNPEIRTPQFCSILLCNYNPLIAVPSGELALQGCTVHVYDENPITLQRVHSTISDQLQELKENGLLEQDQQLRVSACRLLSSLIPMQVAL